MKSGSLSNKILKELFPQYKEEIEQFSREMACGCSYCVWTKLKWKYPWLELPDPDAVYLCI